METIRQENTHFFWKDDLDKYWSDTIWERSAQDRLTWRRHAEAFPKPRDTTAPDDDDDNDDDYDYTFHECVLVM